MSDDYPKPDCEFGVAVRKDLTYIKDTLENILNKQNDFEDILQNGLTTKVDNLHGKVENLQEERTEAKEEEKKKQRREDRRDWEFKKMLVATLLGNILALGGGILIGWLGFA